MWIYSKKLQYPISIKNKDLSMAKFIITQFGGPNGELAASTRYITQRYTMPDEKGKALLTDIGTEELGHMEMVSTMVYQLTQGATMEEIKAAGLQSYYTSMAVLYSLMMPMVFHLMLWSFHQLVILLLI